MAEHKSSMKAIIGASIGNALEWYDFGLYGYLAPTLQALFFPTQSQINGLLSVFLVYAVGLFMRPLGGLIFGYIGDKYGRKIALVSSVSIMAIPMALLGFLPTYSQVGMFAVVLLVGARLLQGLAVGGEMMGAMVFLAEHSPTSKRGFYTSLIYSVGTIGGLLGALSSAFIYYFFSPETVLAGAWRIPFFLGILIGGIGLYIRLKVKETPEFIQLKKEKKISKHPFKEALKNHSREILVTFLLVSFQGVSFYLPFVYLSTWLITEAKFSSSYSLLVTSCGLFFLILCIPFFAALSDRIGRKKILMAGSFGACIIAYPLFKLLSTVTSSPHPFMIALLALLSFAFIIALYQGPLAACLTESVSTKNRYMTLVIGYNSSAAIFGGITPYFATYLVQTTGSTTAPSFMLIATGAIATLVLLFFAKENYKRPLSSI